MKILSILFGVHPVKLRKQTHFSPSRIVSLTHSSFNFRHFFRRQLGKTGSELLQIPRRLLGQTRERLRHDRHDAGETVRPCPTSQGHPRVHGRTGVFGRLRVKGSGSGRQGVRLREQRRK